MIVADLEGSALSFTGTAMMELRSMLIKNNVKMKLMIYMLEYIRILSMAERVVFNQADMR